jgi:hypothetical protein
VLADLQFVQRDQPLIVGGGQVIQHFGFAASRQPEPVRKDPWIIFESFGDIPRTQTNGVTQLMQARVMPLEIGRQQEQVDPQIQLMRELPGRDFGEVTERRHATAWCNRAAVSGIVESGEISTQLP